MVAIANLYPVTNTCATLQVVQQHYCYVVLLVDLLDASATLLGSLRSLVGGNPVLLVATKADLLPAGYRASAVAAWLRQPGLARPCPCAAAAGTARSR